MHHRIRDLDVFYDIRGEGRAIVMVHGFYPDHRLMTGCMEPVLAHVPGWKRIYLDLPGMGRTRSAEWITCADDMLDVLCEFIDAMVPEGTFALAGESYGGYLARGVVKRMPERVSGLALICPVIYAGRGRRTLPPRTLIVSDEELEESLAPEERSWFAGLSVVESPRIWRRTRDEVVSGMKLADVPFLEHFQNTGYAFSFDVDDLPEPFGGPSLIFTGRQDDVVGYRDAWSLVGNYPRATFAAVDLAGHNGQIEQEEVFNALVADWLRRVEESQPHA